MVLKKSALLTISVGALLAAHNASATSELPPPVAGCPQMRSDQQPLPAALIQAGGPVILPAGNYYWQQELTLTNPVSITGAGKDNTKLSFCIDGNSEASIRILSNDTVIQDLEIEVIVRNPRLGGAGGEFGTAITIGRYLEVVQPPAVIGIRIEDIKISRGLISVEPRKVSYTANALAVIGNASHVTIKNIDIYNKHTFGVLMHWGGTFEAGCTAETPFVLDENDMLLCRIVRTHHPHDVNVTGVNVFGSAAIMVGASAAYNVFVKNIFGNGRQALLVLPGDEGKDLAGDEAGALIGSNLHFENFEAYIMGGTTVEWPIQISGRGASKWDGSFHDIKYNNVLFKNMKLRAHSTAVDYFRGLEAGIRLNYTSASQMFRFWDTDMGELGMQAANPKALVILNSRNLHFFNITHSMTNPVPLVQDSTLIDIQFQVP